MSIHQEPHQRIAQPSRAGAAAGGVAAGPVASAGTPLELLGSQPGLSIVDPGTVLTRLWFFDGKFLRAAGFRLDQEYVRSLVALSNQAVGSGVVHGFDVARQAGDRLRVEGGLALAPSGRVTYLPQQVEVSLADLIARSTGSFDPAAAPTGGSADFGRCPPDAGLDPDVVVPARPLYLLTVAGTEALCGEEERFGQLCEDACATETDRSTVVEGVRLRVRELALTLPVSRTVPFTDLHLRSRVASAYYEQERRAVPSMVSGAGLRNPVWCAGADGIGGDEVPLAVLDRSGAVTSMVDGWIARRELMEATPRRYWAWRTSMRPWDIFLAQVLQFQCQLLDLGAGGDGGGLPDPCAGERGTLAAADEVLRTLVDEPGRAPTAGDAVAKTIAAVRTTSLVAGVSPDAYSRIAAVRAKISSVLAGGAVAPTGSLLLDGGVIETPSAGYLPVSLDSDVADQVRAVFGTGVDLRFCAVRPDYVPQALCEAQHMDRISLTRGLDDPADLEAVDVLVPGGEIVDDPRVVAPAFVGVVRVLSRQRSTPSGREEGSALTLSAVARDTTEAGWSWSLAAYGEAPQLLSVPNLVAASLADAGLGAAEAVEPVEVPIRPNHEHDRIRAAASFTQRVVREGRYAAARKARLVTRSFPLGDEPVARPEADRKLAADEDRPVAVWLDVETAAGLDRLTVGGRTDAKLRATVYSRAARTPVLVDARVTGTITVQDVVQRAGLRLIRTVFDGFADTFQTGAGAESRPLRGIALTWSIRGASPTSPTRILGVTLGDPAEAVATFTDIGDPRHVVGEALLVSQRRVVVVTPGWEPGPVIGRRGDPLGEPEPDPEREGEGEVRPVADLELDEDAGALTPGSAARTLAESVISVIGAELALPGRDPAFVATATNRLLGSPGDTGTRRIKATTDWVMFHRRRTIVCGDEVVEQPTRMRTYRLFHVKIGDTDLRRFEALRGRWARSAADLPGVDTKGLDEEARRALRAATELGWLRTNEAADGLGFEPVATLEFPEGLVDLATPTSVLRTSWQAADRGTHLVLAAVGDIGEGDGETVAFGRLATVRSVLADLVDTTATRVEHLLEIPPEFREPGLDGAMFTVGRTQLSRTCVTVYGLTPEAHKLIVEVVSARRETVDVPAVVAEVVDPDSLLVELTVEFDDDTLVDAGAVRTAWGDLRIENVVMGVPAATLERGREGLWRGRALMIGKVIGFGAPQPSGVIVAAPGGCDAVLFVAAFRP
jgi:hypothetical protein